MIEMYLGMFSGGWAIDGRTQAWSAHDDPVAALESWVTEIERQRSRRWRRASVALWLSGGLARPFLCGPVAGLANWDEAEAMAIAMAPDATGLALPCSVRLEAWPGDATALATAVDAQLAQAIAALAGTRRVKWRSVRPRWAALLDEVLAQHAAASLVACVEDDSLTILGGSAREHDAPGAHFELAATHSPLPVADRMTAMWLRTMLSRDVKPEHAWLARLQTPHPGIDRPAGDLAATRGWPDAMRQVEDVSP